MKKLTMAWVLGLGCALAASAATGEEKYGAKKTGEGTLTATGCLEKGDVANTYKLTHVTGGGDWELVDAPATLKLSDHLGHKVGISGTPLGPSTGEKTADEKGVSSGTGSGAHTHVEKTPSPEDRGISSGKGSGAKEMKDQKRRHQLKVTSMKHVAATCP